MPSKIRELIESHKAQAENLYQSSKSEVQSYLDRGYLGGVAEEMMFMAHQQSAIHTLDDLLRAIDRMESDNA